MPSCLSSTENAWTPTQNNQLSWCWGATTASVLSLLCEAQISRSGAVQTSPPPHPTNIRKSSTNEFWEQVCHDIRERGQREWSQKVLMLWSGSWVQKSPGAAKTSVYPLMGTFCYRVNKSSSSSQRGLWKPSENICFLGLTQHRQGMTIFLLCALVCVDRAFLDIN